MTQPSRCSYCDALLPVDAPAGVCPRCLLKAGIGDAPPVLHDSPPTETATPTISPGIQPGSKIRYVGEYELLGEIARGGMGIVYKARQQRLNRVVALKLILAGQFASEAEVRRFHMEAEAAAQLDHPGIVPIFEVGEHDGYHFFSMPLVEGITLAERIADGPLSAHQAAELLQKIVAAVDFAHEKGVVHRDLKPANILIDHNGEPRVTDFGLAKHSQSESRLTETGQILGTPGFMAPEQATGGKSAIAASADIYALGAVLYCALTGKPPFHAETPAKTIWQLTHDLPERLRKHNASIPTDIEAICLKCLEKSPDHRYTSAQDLADDLTRFLSHQSVVARHPTAMSSSLRWCRRHRRSITIVLTTCVVGLVLMGSLQWLREWYTKSRTGQLALDVASSNTPVDLYSGNESQPARRILVAGKQVVDLPSGEYELWAERYGQRWQVPIQPRQTLELNLEDSARHDLFLRTRRTLTYPNQVVPVRREDRTDLLTESKLYDGTRQWRVLELHHGWNGERLWTCEIPIWNPQSEGPKKIYLEHPGVEITADFDRDGAADLALLKAGHYLVLSSASGEVLLDHSIDIVDRFGSSRMSFGKFLDVTQDKVLDFVFRTDFTFQAIDGSNGAKLWQAEVPRAEQKLTITGNDKTLLVIVNEPTRETKGELLLYDLSDGSLHRKMEMGEYSVESLGLIRGGDEPLLLVNEDRQEFRAIGLTSGDIAWQLIDDNWSHFCARDDPRGWTGTLILEDLTGDGVTDAVLALRQRDPENLIQLALIDGSRGEIVWQHKLGTKGFTLARPAVYGEPGSVPGQSGELYCAYFAANGLRLDSIDPSSGDFTWSSDVPTGGVWLDNSWFYNSHDGSHLPSLVIGMQSDVDESTLLQVDKRTGVPFRRISVGRSLTPVLMLADFDRDGLADFMVGETLRPTSAGGVTPLNVATYRGRPREWWRRPGESCPLPDLDDDGVEDCLTLGATRSVVSGSTGKALWQLPSLPKDPILATTMTWRRHGNGGNGFVAQIVEKGYRELSTFVSIIDIPSGRVVGEIDDKLDGYWGSDPGNQLPTRLLFPDLDGDGQPEVAVSGDAPWRVYSIVDKKRLFSGSGFTKEWTGGRPPPTLIGYFTGEDGLDRLIEITRGGPATQNVSVSAIGVDGRAEWWTRLSLPEGFRGMEFISGVTTEDFDDDGEPDVILWRGADLWVLDRGDGSTKLHTSRAQTTSSAVFMVRTETGLPALAVPHRTLIAADGQITNQACIDVLKLRDSAGDGGEIYVWLKSDGRVVARGSDGRTILWEANLPDRATANLPQAFDHELRWEGAVVIAIGDDLFALDAKTGEKLWRGESGRGRRWPLVRTGRRLPLIVSSADTGTICREVYPVDDDWNYRLPLADPSVQPAKPE